MQQNNPLIVSVAVYKYLKPIYTPDMDAYKAIL